MAGQQREHGPGAQRHHGGAQGRPPQAAEEIHLPVEAAVHGDHIQHHDQRVAVQCAHRRAADAHVGVAHHQVVGDDLQRAAAQERPDGDALPAVGLQDAVGGHHQAHEDAGDAQHRQVIGGGLRRFRHGRIQKVQDRPGQHRQSRPHGKGQQRRDPQRRGSQPCGGVFVAAGTGLGNGGDQGHRQRINERGRQHEQRHAEGVLTVQLRGGVGGQSQRALQGAQHQRLVQQRHQAHAAAGQRNGDPDPQQLPRRVSPALRNAAAASAAAAPQCPQQKQQSQHRAAGNAGNGPGGAGLRRRPAMQQKGAQAQPDHQLAGGFHDLADGGGGHVPHALGIPPDGGDKTHAQHRGGQHPDHACRGAVVQQPGDGFREKEHHRGKDKAGDAQQQQRRVKDPPGLPGSSQRTRPCHQPRGGQRQSGGGQHQQQVIDVVGGIEVGHAPAVQQISQRDLVQGAQHLGNGHRAGQNGRAA